MTRVDWFVFGFLAGFAVLVLFVFRKRWQGALGWLTLATAFVSGLVYTRNAEGLVGSVVIAVAAVIGVGLVGFDYYRFERPKRRARLAADDPLTPPSPFKIRRRPPLMQRRRFQREARH